MNEVSAIELINILDSKTAQKVWEYFRGCRVYFPKKKIEREEIRQMYDEMTKRYKIDIEEAIKKIAVIFEKKEKTIKELLLRQQKLFEL